MAERLLQPVPPSAVQVTDAGFGDQFVGFSAPVADRQQAVAAVPVQVPVPLVAPIVVSAIPVVEVPETPVAVGTPFLDRMNRFRDWLRHHFDASGVFLLDQEGVIMFDESGHGRLHFLARSLALGSRHSAEAPPHVHVRVGAGATLEVIPVNTTSGCIVLGAVVPAPLDPVHIATVMDGLRMVAGS